MKVEENFEERMESKEDLLLDGEYVPVAEEGTPLGEHSRAYIYMLMAKGQIYSFIISEMEDGKDKLFKNYALHGLFRGKVGSWYLPLVNLGKPLKTAKYRNLEAAECDLNMVVYDLVEELILARNLSADQKIKKFSLLKRIENFLDVEKMKANLLTSSRKDFIKKYIAEMEGQAASAEAGIAMLNNEFNKLFEFVRGIKPVRMKKGAVMEGQLALMSF
ncbi:hypothetical protein ACTNDZ_13495 [Selenomonas montiformis]|uniref:hypothetical protein n=1 Tax=Selenomonas montiformis TaxID=2652285 RepID=UPI003F8870E4